MMPNHVLLQAEREEFDRYYRAGGLQRMAPPLVHYREPICPHSLCDYKLEWIDFQIQDQPKVRSWWLGEGFAGRCPRCGNWIKFTSMKMHPITEDEAKQLPTLPDNWHTQAMFG